MKKTGKDSADSLMNFLIGQIMAKTGGKASPPIVRQLILERLSENTQEGE